MKKSRLKVRTPKVRTHKNRAAAALASAEFRPRRTADETKVIPRKRKHGDELD